MMVNNEDWFERVLDDEAEDVRTYQPEFNIKGAKIPMPTLNWIDGKVREHKKQTLEWLESSLSKLNLGARTEGIPESVAQEAIIGLKKRITELKKEIK